MDSNIDDLKLVFSSNFLLSLLVKMSKEKEKIDTNQWVDLYADYLFNYCVSRVNDVELAKDLVQDTFIAGIKGLDNFEGKSAVKTWLVSILKRKIIDYWRQKESRKTEPFSSFFTNEPKGAHWLENRKPKGMLADIDVQLNNDELGDALQDCISYLPSKWRQIFIDKMVDQKDSEEVCKVNDITPSNFWVIIHRAKLQMRECLEKKWFND